jgi:hypothetical protein
MIFLIFLFLDTNKVHVKLVGNNVEDSQLRHFLMVVSSCNSNISYVMRDNFTSNLCATFGTSSSERSLIVATNLVRNEEALHGVKENRNVLHTIKRRKENWIGWLLLWNRHLKHVIDRNVVGSVEGRKR